MFELGSLAFITINNYFISDYNSPYYVSNILAYKLFLWFAGTQKEIRWPKCPIFMKKDSILVHIFLGKFKLCLASHALLIFDRGLMNCIDINKNITFVIEDVYLAPGTLVVRQTSTTKCAETVK